MESNNLGEILKEARKEKGFTLRELSERSGVSHSYISQLENGRNNNPTPLFLKRISDALSLPFTTLAALTEGNTKFSDGDIATLKKMEKEAEQAIEMLNMIWTSGNENYKLVLEDANSLESYLNLLDTLLDVRPLIYNGHELTPGERQQIIDMLIIIFPQYQNKKE